MGAEQLAELLRALPDGVDQRTSCNRLLDQGIATKRGIMYAHRQPAYQTELWSCEPGAPHCTCPGGNCGRLAASEHAENRSLMLPLYSQMTVEDQDQVVAALADRCA